MMHILGADTQFGVNRSFFTRPVVAIGIRRMIEPLKVANDRNIRVIILDIHQRTPASMTNNNIRNKAFFLQRVKGLDSLLSL